MDIKKDFLKAKKEIKSNRKDQNYMTISWRYGTELVLRYDDGLKLLNCLEHAEEFTGAYEDRRITALGSDSVKTTLLPRIEYENHKIAALLNVKYSEITDHVNDVTLTESIKCRT
jgi:hypothetical protein